MRAITALRANGIPISELSRLTGVNIDTIRYYEKVKMLPAPRRTDGGHRVYGANETRTLVFIRRGRELGFTLVEIRALLDLREPGKASCGEVRKIATHHLTHIRSRIDDLVKLEKLLAKTIGRCSGGKVPDCPVLDLLDVQRVAHGANAEKHAMFHRGRVVRRIKHG
jgi:MerR family transcriptional regulator, mercuric resistance operon regulatory protein